MLTKNEILAYLALRKKYFLDEYGISKIGLFGSFSNGNFDKDSDIDLLIEFKPETSNLYDIKAKLKEELQEKFKRKIDLCREKYLKPYYRKEIISSTLYV